MNNVLIHILLHTHTHTHTSHIKLLKHVTQVHTCLLWNFLYTSTENYEERERERGTGDREREQILIL